MAPNYVILQSANTGDEGAIDDHHPDLNPAGGTVL